MRKELVLIRHGETEWNAQRRWQGHSDVPLNAKGIRQAESLAAELRVCPLDVLFSSDLTRAHQTARIIAVLQELPVLTSEGLREIDVGSAEGLGYDETVARFGRESILRWRSLLPDDLDFGFPGGETKLQAARRAFQAISHIVQSNGAMRIGLVSHGMLIRMFLHRVFPKLEIPSVLPNCGYVQVSYDLYREEWSWRRCSGRQLAWASR